LFAVARDPFTEKFTVFAVPAGSDTPIYNWSDVPPYATPGCRFRTAASVNGMPAAAAAPGPITGSAAAPNRAPVTAANAAPQVLVIITGVAATATAAQAVTVGGRYGTGTAPANAASVTGTRFGAAADPVIGPGAAAAAGIPFTLAAVLNLQPGVAYWFDLAVSTGNASDAASVTAVGVTIAELP
jgi:hypothetical protein